MRRERSLVGLAAWRIAIFAVVAMVLQVGLVLLHYYRDDHRLADLMLDREAEALSAGFVQQGSGFGFELPTGLDRYANGKSIARIRLPTGEVLFSNCDDNCLQHLLPLDLAPPDSWLRMLSAGKPIQAAGGRTLNIGGRDVFVEIGMLGDSGSVMWSVLTEELTEHMAVPMLLMLVLTFGATLLSIRRSLRPVSAAAAAAETLDPLDPRSRLSAEGMPREIAGLIGAVNRALSRIGDVMRAQKSYTTAIAHEVRVPLAAMKLALNQITDPRASKIDEDIDRLSHLVTQLTDLGRLDAFDRSSFASVDLAELARKVVEDMAPLVFESGREIGYGQENPSSGFGLAVLIEDAVRNLVDNAVVHTPPGTSITVSAGPGPRIRVVDTAGIESQAYRLSGSPGAFKRGDRVGIGLDIVRKIIDLHAGTFAISVEPGQMTSVEITIPHLPTRPDQ